MESDEIQMSNHRTMYSQVQGTMVSRVLPVPVKKPAISPINFAQNNSGSREPETQQRRLSTGPMPEAIGIDPSAIKKAG